jgi:hypothetical protein
MSTVDLLRAHAPSAPDALRERVLAARPTERVRVLRVRPVVVLAGAAALAIAAAFVHGFTTSAPAPVVVEKAPSVLRGAAATTTADSTAKLQTRVAAVPAQAAGRLQHTDASITVRVDDVGAMTNRATQIASSLGGYAQSVRYRSRGASYIELRIPAQHVKEALVRLAALGVLVSQQISIDDLTATLQRQSDQIAQLRRRIAALNAALRDTSLPESQRVLLQIKLAESKRALAQRVHGRKETIAAGQTARVSLVLTTRKQAAAVPHHRGRLDRMLHSALGFLAVEGMVVLFALIVISPFVLAGALVWWFRRRAVDRLLME